MPGYFPEDNEPLPSDNKMRSLQKIVDLEGGGGGGGGGGDAPANATFITRQPESGLSNETALSTLATGLLTSTTGTGALTVEVTKSGSDYTFPGAVIVPTGAAATPTLAFAGTTTGFYKDTSDSVIFTSASTPAMMFAPTAIILPSTSELRWVSTADPVAGTADVILLRDAANTLAQRNGTTAQAFNVYKTFTNSTQYERLAISGALSAGEFSIYAEKGSGGGTLRDLGFWGSNLRFYFGASGSTAWMINSSGHLLAGADNLYTIGAAGANRPLQVNVGTSGILSAGNVLVVGDVRVSAANYFYWDTRSTMASPSDGVITFFNNALTGFSRLNFGGTTSSFPSLKRTTTTLIARLADDSADTQLQGSFMTATGAAANALEATNAAGGATIGSGGSYVFSSRARLQSSADGVIELFNNAANSFTRLSYGNLTYQAVGTGTPESVVTAPVGSLFMRTNGGSGSTLYVKESGAGNTGWVAVQSASGAAAGASGDIQYNNGSGGFAAEAAFNYNAATNVFSLGDGTNFSRLKNNGAGILEIVDGATAQTLRIYSTTTNDKRFSITTSGSSPLNVTLAAENSDSATETNLNINCPTGNTNSINLQFNSTSFVWMHHDQTNSRNYLRVDEGGPASGNSIASLRFIGFGSASLDFNFTTGVDTLTISVTGAADGDVVAMGAPNGSVGATAQFTAWVSSANTVSIRGKASAAEASAAGTFKVLVFRAQ